MKSTVNVTFNKRIEIVKTRKLNSHNLHCNY